MYCLRGTGHSATGSRNMTCIIHNAANVNKNAEKLSAERCVLNIYSTGHVGDSSSFFYMLCSNDILGLVMTTSSTGRDESKCKNGIKMNLTN